MKTSYEDFRVMKLRPAINNDKEIELSVQIDSYLSRTTYYDSVALGLKLGDTVSVRGRICYDNSRTREYITIYMSDNILTEFINKFGSDKIVAEVNIKADFVYAIVNKTIRRRFRGKARRDSCLQVERVFIIIHF